MLNYIAAELYKLRHKKGLFIGVLLLLILESLVFLPGLWVDEVTARGISRGALYAFFSAVLYPMLLLPPIFAVTAFDDQYGHGTLKNELVYGIPRSRAYLGKLAAGALAGTGVAALASGWFILLAQLTGRRDRAPDVGLGWLFRVLLAHWCVWLAILAFTFLLLTLFRSTAGALFCVYLSIFVGGPISLMPWGENWPLWFRLGNELFFTAPLRFIFTEDSHEPGRMILPLVGESWLAYAAVVGIFWVVGSTGLGLLLICRREIK